MKVTLAFFVCLAFLCVSAMADIEVMTVDNQRKKGEIVEIQAGPPPFIILQTKEGREKLEFPDIVEVLCQKAMKPPSAPVCLLLNEGSQIYGQITDGNQQFIHIESYTFGVISVDLTKIKEIRFDSAGELPEKIDQENDTIYFKTGDTMKGVIDSFGKGFVQVRHEQLGLRKEYFEKLQRITFAQLEKPNFPANVLLATVVGVDHSRLSGEIIKFTSNTLSLRLPYLNTEIHPVLERIHHLFFKGGRFVYVSDLPADRYQVTYVPFFPGPVDPFLPKMDQNQHGGPIRLKGESFYKGIGVFSRTEIKILLKGEYRRFQSDIGIDDSISELFNRKYYMIGGSVVFQIFVDGSIAYDSGVMRWGSPTQTVNVDVGGRKELLLVVDFADNAHVNDLANWAGARLIR